MARAARGLFITGTDTGVGKTLVGAALVDGLARSGMRVGVMKPVAAGADETSEGLRNSDALELLRASNVRIPYRTANPYCLKMPASPHIAAAMESIHIDPAFISQSFGEVARLADAVVVEGAGGWLAPINETQTMADVAIGLGLPVVLVVGLRLGCLNHALLTVQAVAASGLPLAGWIANHTQPLFEQVEANITSLERRLGAPLLDVVTYRPPPAAEGAPAAAVALSDHAIARIGEVLRA